MARKLCFLLITLVFFGSLSYYTALAVLSFPVFLICAPPHLFLTFDLKFSFCHVCTCLWEVKKWEDCNRAKTRNWTGRKLERVWARGCVRETQKDNVTRICIWTQRPQRTARKRITGHAWMYVVYCIIYGIKKAIKSAKVCMCANQMLNMLLLQFHFYGWVNTLIEVVSSRDINLVYALHEGP